MQTEQAQHYMPQARLGGIKILHVQLTETKTSRPTVCSVVQSSAQVVYGIPILFADEPEAATAFKNEKGRSMEPKGGS